MPFLPPNQQRQSTEGKKAVLATLKNFRSTSTDVEREREGRDDVGVEVKCVETDWKVEGKDFHFHFPDRPESEGIRRSRGLDAEPSPAHVSSDFFAALFISFSRVKFGKDVCGSTASYPRCPRQPGAKVGWNQVNLVGVLSRV